MAMPASGSIAIISAPQTCGSICAAVGLASGSLSALSVAAGTAGCMRNFYGYNPVVTRNVNFSCTILLNSSVACCKCGQLSYSSTRATGECFYPSFCFDICKTTDLCISYAGVCVICNAVTIYSCELSGKLGGTASGIFAARCVDYNDSISYYVSAESNSTPGDPSKYASAYLCIHTITDCVGDYNKCLIRSSVIAEVGIAP